MCFSHLCGTKHLRSTVMTATLTGPDLFTVRQRILFLAPRDTEYFDGRNEKLHIRCFPQEAGELITRRRAIPAGCYSRRKVSGSSRHDITLTSRTRHQLLHHFNTAFSHRALPGKLSHVRLKCNSLFHLCTSPGFSSVLWQVADTPASVRRAFQES